MEIIITQNQVYKKIKENQTEQSFWPRQYFAKIAKISWQLYSTLVNIYF